MTNNYQVSIKDSPRIVQFKNSDGYKAAIRADRVDAITYSEDRDPGYQTLIYLTGSDVPIGVEDSYEEAIAEVFGLGVPKESQRD